MMDRIKMLFFVNCFNMQERQEGKKEKREYLFRELMSAFIVIF